MRTLTKRLNWLLLMLLAAPAGAQVIVIFPQRQAERKASRWTLADWMNTKRTIAAQNAWLAAHTNKVPFDFTFGAEVSNHYAAIEGDIYYGRLGVKARYLRPAYVMNPPPKSVDPQRTGQQYSLQLRLFGGNIQDTNLIVRAFYENDELKSGGHPQGEFRGFGLGPELQIYLAKWLGVRGDWNYRLSRHSQSDAGLSLGGSSWSAVAFLEMSSLRFEAGYAEQTFEFSHSTDIAQNGKWNDGALIGRLRLFF